MKVLIVAKTRMGSGSCIGAISETHNSVRLVHPNPENVPNFNAEYEIGDLWDISSNTDATERPEPHVEDIVVHAKEWLQHIDDCVPTIAKYMSPKLGSPENLFDGLTQVTGFGAMYITERTGVPKYSTMFWRPDKPLILDRTGKRLRYRYETGKWR